MAFNRSGKPQSGSFTGGPGVFRGGPMGSGTARVAPERPMTDDEKQNVRERAADSPTFRGGVTGSGVPKPEVIGEGDFKQYRDIPVPKNDRGDRVPRSYTQIKSDNARFARQQASNGINAGSSRPAPGSSVDSGKGREAPKNSTAGKDGAKAGSGSNPERARFNAAKPSSSTSSASSTSSDKPKTAPAAPGSLNYFMKITNKDNKGNDNNRAYQMYKNYKKTGKLPVKTGAKG
ncbi:hypothetical protein UFOVP929_22 [uncultured Caudovirales phage]|uniref:Uncharacterized protein n=1 Tax=uncultured Caudovirales phage TaxID=2100421 RepID=A0A6J5PPB1_9CAUD|nr:hypothetical protein UFOVP929_22 [uncultured Caudovirales phage]